MAGDGGRRYVIIGNGIAGTTCAQALRKNDISCSIWLITNESYPLYNRVSLKRLLDGVLPEQKVMMRDFAWHEQQRITLLTETRVIHVDTEERVVYLDQGSPLRYDALLLASGGRAQALDVPGGEEARNMYSFISLDDTKAIIVRALLTDIEEPFPVGLRNKPLPGANKLLNLSPPLRAADKHRSNQLDAFKDELSVVLPALLARHDTPDRGQFGAVNLCDAHSDDIRVEDGAAANRYI